MRTICHIGHHKTGTTTLQAFLSQNSHRLLTEGILYPWTESEGAAFALAKAVGAGDEAAILPINIREAHNALAFRMLSDALPNWKVPPYHKDLPHSHQMLLAISKQIAALEPEGIVICSEVMSHFGKIAVGEIGRLRRRGLGQADEFTLWCTLRRPDEQLVSWHGQQVGFGWSPAPLSDPDRGMNLEWLHVDYRGVVEPWLREIPEAQLVLRPYREVIAVGGSVEDFRVNSGLRMPLGLLTLGNMNTSFKPAVISLLRLANARLSKPHARELKDTIDRLTRDMTLSPTTEVEFLGQAARARLVAHFKPIHDWLARTTGRAAFFDNIDGMAQCLPVSEQDSLQRLLDQLTWRKIAKVKTPEISAFLKDLRNTGATL